MGWVPASWARLPTWVLCYIQDSWAKRMCLPPNSYVKTLTPRVAAFGDEASEEVTEVKRVTRVGTLIR